MHLKKINSKGVTRLYFYDTYYSKDPETGKGRYRSKMIESLGRLDELQKQYNDPISYFKQVAADRTKKKKEDHTETIEIDTSKTMDVSEDNLKNVGYVVLKELYRDLELDKFWSRRIRRLSIDYSIDQIFRLLVFSRALFPASKKKTYEERTQFFEPFTGFDLDNVYYSLDIIAKYQEALQKWIFDHSGSICERDMSVSYFDCTNYYFDIGRSDQDQLNENGEPVDKDGNVVPAKYRKRGPEKNHRPDPIVGMGLLMDRNGIPLAYDLFPGNESEKLHMRPIVDRVKEQFSNTRIIFVADRGLNTSDNIYWLNGDNRREGNPRDGYVYGQSVRGASEEFTTWLLDGDYQKDTIIDDAGDEITFTHKSRIFPRELHVNVTKPGQKKPVKKTVLVDQKQMVYYSEKYAKKQKADRDVMIERAKDLVLHPKKYDKVTSAGSASYVKNISFNKTTGEIAEGKDLSVDWEKVAEEEKFDGYYSIVTSELKMSDLEMRNIYRGLSKIEESFKITKSSFRTHPVHVWTNAHIDAHFAICFTALVLIRLLQARLNNRYPVEKILRSLRKYNCTKIGTNLYQFLYYDEILASCSEKFELDLNHMYHTQGEIRQILKYR